MKLFRHRRPSLKTILGVTKAKKRLKKELGITALLKPFRWWGNTKRTLKRKIGYESEPWRILRNGIPKPGGCLLTLLGIILAFALASYSIKVVVASRNWGPSNEIFTVIHNQLATTGLLVRGAGTSLEIVSLTCGLGM
jgi:hypothetical protein